MKFVKKLTEGDVQCRLYEALRKQGVDVYAEYVVSSKSLGGGRGCRFDLVIVYADEIVGIIEVKNTKKLYTPKKITYYEKVSGVPVFVCCNVHYIGDVVNKVKDLLQKLST
jgi:hypothetical protein